MSASRHMEPAHYVVDFDPFLIRFTENLGIRYYGLAYVLAFVIAGVLLRFYWKRGRSPLNSTMQSDLLFAIILGTFIGGRLGYFLFYTPGELLRDPLSIVRIWDGGMASHGGFIGVFLGLWWTAHKHKLSFVTVGDIVCTLAPPGLLLGRIANFINGELWGRKFDGPWGMIFPLSSESGVDKPILIEPRHPSQLYEAATEGLLLMLYTQWRIWRTPDVLKQPGRLAGEFLLGYAIARVFCENYREHDRDIPQLLGLNRGAWLSFAVAAAGVFLIIRAIRKSRVTPSQNAP